MLSRLAEHLYWIGRYVERADDQVRLASALYFGGTHIGSLGDPQLPADLIGVLGAAPGLSPAASLGEAVEWCVCDPANPSSAASCLQAARENTRRAREVLSLELWEIISEATMRLQEFRTREAGVEEYLLAAPWWTRAYYGVVESALPRDEARAVLRLGVVIERADLTLRLLILGASHREVGDSDPATVHFWMLLLKACGALDAYRKMVARPLNGDSVAELLLKEERCPRSVLYCLQAAERITAGEGDRSRRIGRLRSELEFRSTEELLAGGQATFERLLDGTDSIHATLVRELLRPAELL